MAQISFFLSFFFSLFASFLKEPHDLEQHLAQVERQEEMLREKEKQIKELTAKLNQAMMATIVGSSKQEERGETNNLKRSGQRRN